MVENKQMLRTPFDVLINNFLTAGSEFNPIKRYGLGYPADVYLTSNSLVIEIACVGADKSNIQIKVQDKLLRVSYKRDLAEKVEDSREYIYKSVVRRDFDLGWKITDGYDLSKLSATLEKGLLQITIPVSEKKEESIHIVEIN